MTEPGRGDISLSPNQGTLFATPPDWTAAYPNPWSGPCRVFDLAPSWGAGTYRFELELQPPFPLHPRLILGDGKSAHTLLKFVAVGQTTYRCDAVLTAPVSRVCLASDDLEEPVPWQRLIVRKQSPFTFLTTAARQFWHLIWTDRRRARAFAIAALKLLIQRRAPSGVHQPPLHADAAYQRWLRMSQPDDTNECLSSDQIDPIEGTNIGRVIVQNTHDHTHSVWLVHQSNTYHHHRKLLDVLARVPAECQLVTFDDDRIDDEGSRSAPFFRPAWSPAYLASWDYIGAAFALRENASAPNLQTDNSGDPSLSDLIGVTLSSAEVHHEPTILGHWRVRSDAPDPRLNSSPWPSKPAIRFASDTAPSVEIIVPTRDRLALLEACIDSIDARTNYPAYTVTVVDNGSTDTATLDYLRAGQAAGRFKVLRDDGDFNYSRLNNGAAAQSKADYLLLLNNDTTVLNADWLSQMVAAAAPEDVGAVGAKLFYPNGTIQHGGLVMGLMSSIAGHVHKEEPGEATGYFGSLVCPREVGALTAACLLVRRDFYHAVGGFNETDLPIAFNDVDLCLKLRASGKRLIWTPFAELIHHESISRGTVETVPRALQASREVDYMRRTWGQTLRQDDFYSPNLSRNSFRPGPAP